MTPDDPVPAGSDMTCQELVELVTAFLDDALPGDERTAVEAHLQVCGGCQTLLAQWRTVIELAGQLTEDDVDNADPISRDRLLSTFRDLRRR